MFRLVSLISSAYTNATSSNNEAFITALRCALTMARVLKQVEADAAVYFLRTGCRNH